MLALARFIEWAGIAMMVVGFLALAVNDAKLRQSRKLFLLTRSFIPLGLLGASSGRGMPKALAGDVWSIAALAVFAVCVGLLGGRALWVFVHKPGPRRGAHA